MAARALDPKSTLRNLVHSPWAVLFLSLFADFVFSGGYLFQNRLYGDNIKNFGHFRDLLDSVSRFGMPAWWFPQYLTGFPGYFYSMLTVPSYSNPMFGVIALPIWVLGKLGVHFTHYQPIFVIYAGFLNPTLFVFAFWLLVKRLFKNPFCIAYATILAAFSPGVAFASIEIGWLEHTTYSLFLFSSIIDWLRKPDRKNYWRVLFSLCLLGISFNIGFLYWNLFVIPFFLFLYRKPLLRKLPLLKPIEIAGASFVILLTILPNLLAVSQGKDLVRISLGETMRYPFERLLPGAPSEFLIASLPGFGFDWLNQRSLLYSIGADHHVAYYYLGLVTLPLLMIGLIFGNRRYRYPLLAFLAFYALGACLEGFSPFFGALQFLPSPLKSCNHFCDAVYKFGPFLLVVLGSTLGLKTLLHRKELHRFFAICFALTALSSIGIYVLFFQSMIFHQLHFNTLIAFLFFFFVLFSLYVVEKNNKKLQLNCLLLLTLADVGTFSFFWVRDLWVERTHIQKGARKAVPIDESVATNGIGLLDSRAPHHAANSVIMYTPYFRMRMLGYEGFDLPKYYLFSSTGPQQELETELGELEEKRFEKRGYLPMDSSELGNPELKRFLIAPTPMPQSIRVTDQTYNDLKLEVSLDRPGLLFIRDAFSPYWSAFVDGKKTTLHRAFFNYKGIALEPGKHSVSLSFWPTLVPESLFLSYLLLGTFGFLSLSFSFSLKNLRIGSVRNAAGLAQGHE